MRKLTMDEKRKWLRDQEDRVRKSIAAASRGGMYAGGLAGEGYNGGYRDALSDVILLLNSVIPNHRNFC